MLMIILFTLFALLIGLLGLSLLLVPFVSSSFWSRLVRPPVSGQRDAPGRHAGLGMWLWMWFRIWR